MVLPTTSHAPLTTWLNSRKRNCAHELGGSVVLNALSPIERLIDPMRLSTEVQELFRFARAAPRMSSSVDDTVHAAREMLRDPVTAALQGICGDLEARGVEAEPYTGLGVLSGDEIFDCAIVIGSPVRLAELLGVSYVPGPLV